jgi:hypothetical protein
MALTLDATRAELTLGLPLCRRAQGDFEVSRFFGSSMLWWPTERALVRLPDFRFSFTLAVNMLVDPDDFHGPLLYQYMRFLRCDKNSSEFEASVNADYLRALDRHSIINVEQTHNLVATEKAGDDLAVRWRSHARHIEALLAKACLHDTRALFAEKAHNYKRDHGLLEEDADDADVPLHCLFEAIPWERGTWTPNAAFQSVFEIRCRNHVIASSLVAALLPFRDVLGADMTPENPPLDERSYGRRFYFSNNRVALCHLVAPRAKSSVLQAVFRGNQTSENVALAAVVRQLGTKEPLEQCYLHRIVDARPVFHEGEGMLLAPADTPFYHPIFSKAVALPRPDLLAKTRVQPSPSETGGAEAIFNCEIVMINQPPVLDPEKPTPALVQYWGELFRDCSLERRFGIVAPVARNPAPQRHAGGIEGPTPRPRVEKRLRTLDDDSDGLPRNKRARILAESLEFLRFLTALSLARTTADNVRALLVERPDFFEVLACRKQFGGLSRERLQQCVDIVLSEKFYKADSSVVQSYREFIAKK